MFAGPGIEQNAGLPDSTGSPTWRSPGGGRGHELEARPDARRRRQHPRPLRLRGGAVGLEVRRHPQGERQPDARDTLDARVSLASPACRPARGRCHAPSRVATSSSAAPASDRIEGREARRHHRRRRLAERAAAASGRSTTRAERRSKLFDSDDPESRRTSSPARSSPATARRPRDPDAGLGGHRRGHRGVLGRRGPTTTSRRNPDDQRSDDHPRAGPAIDGTDTLRNVERLTFSDQTVEVNPLLTNTPATGTVTLSDTTPAENQQLTATRAFNDADGVDAPSIQFAWQMEEDPDAWDDGRHRHDVHRPVTRRSGSACGSSRPSRTATECPRASTRRRPQAVANVNDDPTGRPVISDTTPREGDAITAQRGTHPRQRRPRRPPCSRSSGSRRSAGRSATSQAR